MKYDLAEKFPEGAEIAATRGFSGDMIKITSYNPRKKENLKQKKTASRLSMMYLQLKWEVT